MDELNLPTDKRERGYLKLELKAEAQPSFEAFKGTVRVWDHTARFKSLLPASTKSFYNFESWEWDSNPDFLDDFSEGEREDIDKDHEFMVSDVKDDEGNPFVQFNLNCGGEYAFFLAKKEGKKKGEQKLSKGERERLGWGIGGEELERRNTGESESSSDDEQGSAGDEESRDSGEDSGNISDGSDEESEDGKGVPVRTTGTKRKAEGNVDVAEGKRKSRKRHN